MQEQEVQGLVSEKVTEVVNVSDWRSPPANSPPPTKKPSLFTLERAIFATIVLILIVALALSFILGREGLYAEDTSVNAMLGNMLQSDLGKQLAERPEHANVMQIAVLVEIHAESENLPAKVSDITDSDRVTARVEFFPQESIAEFARDAYAVLRVMLAQSARLGVVYDEIVFTAQDPFTHMTATVSGRYASSLTRDDIAGITYYFGDVAVDS